jgi:hypothetical protein
MPADTKLIATDLATWCEYQPMAANVVDNGLEAVRYVRFAQNRHVLVPMPDYASGKLQMRGSSLTPVGMEIASIVEPVPLHGTRPPAGHEDHVGPAIWCRQRRHGGKQGGGTTHASLTRCLGTRKLVGAAGFEPTTPCPPGRCATRLRYAPTFTVKPKRARSVADTQATTARVFGSQRYGNVYE